MSVLSQVKRAIGVGAARPSDSEENGDPSHVCDSCGETYYTDPGAEIPTCRRCGGIKVKAA